jgi:hypothetical protein
MRQNSLVRTTLCALGFTVTYLFWILKPIQDAPAQELYHWGGHAREVFVPYILFILAVWLLFTALLLPARKPGRVRAAIWTFLLLCIACLLIKLNIFYHRFDSVPAAFDCAAILTLLVTLSWRPSRADRFERVLKPITTIFIFLGLLGAFILCQLFWADRRGSLADQHRPLHQRNAAATVQLHRIVWIVFDELSFQQTYEHRYPGLRLPAFDSLAASSTLFTHATPFFIRTEEVLPGLFSGIPFDKIRNTFSAAPSFHNAVTGDWQAFDQHDTLFKDALSAGYSTAVVGWYNPYCRLIPAVLDSCYWRFQVPSNTTLAGQIVLSNTGNLAIQAVRGVLTILPPRLTIYLMRRSRVLQESLAGSRVTEAEDYQDLQSRADQLLRDPSYNFVLLHLPVPHPPGFYNRHTHQFTTEESSYIDNLALADSWLASIVQTLKQTNQWDSSTVVLMGDHGWRTQQIWRPMKIGWTKEDELASHGGQYDPRPVYLVKLPNQTIATRIETPYNTVNTRKLFDAIMAHQINTPADLAAWTQSTH